MVPSVTEEEPRPRVRGEVDGAEMGPWPDAEDQYLSELLGYDDDRPTVAKRTLTPREKFIRQCEEMWRPKGVLPVLCPHPDYAALMALYNATDGPNWNNNTGWSDGVAGTDCGLCEWYGVTCDGNGRVFELILSDNHLQGFLPDEVGDFTFLRRFEIGGSFANSNNVSGLIPSTFSELQNLEDVDFSFNSFSGDPFLELLEIQSLREIRVGGNNFSGEFPAQITTLVNLEKISIGENNFMGSIPADISNLTNLTSLYIGQNPIVGSLPQGLGALINLTSLDIQRTNISGEIPEQLGNLTNLTRLQLRRNNLTGTLPVSLSNLVNLSFFSVEDNELTGDFPSFISSFNDLTWLDLSGNEFEGQLPEDIGGLTNLARLYLENNNLYGELPSSITNLTNVNELRLRGNQLTGSIPFGLGNLTRILSSSNGTLHLNGNNFSGCIPEDLLTFCDTDLRLDNNPGLPWGGDVTTFCAEVSNQVGAPCNDNDPATENDVIQADCSCAGVVSCPTGTTYTVTTTADSGPGSLRQGIECVNNDPSLDLIRFDAGLGAATISVTSALPAITDDDVDIRALNGTITIDGSALSNAADSGLPVYGNNFLVSNIHIDNFPSDGFYLSGVDGGTVQFCGASSNGRIDSEGNGIEAENGSANILISSCEIDGNESGIFLNSVIGFTVSFNNISGNGKGVDVADGQTGTMDGNVVQNSTDLSAGIYIQGGDDIEIGTTVGNSIYNNRTGLQLTQVGTNITIENNQIGSNGFGQDFGNSGPGLFLSGSPTGVRIADNIIGFNTSWGIAVGDGSDEIQISQNNLFCNDEGVFFFGNANQSIAPPTLSLTATNRVEGNATGQPFGTVEIYRVNNDDCGANSVCQGSEYLATVSAAGGLPESDFFSWTPDPPLNIGDRITVLTIDLDGTRSSEFSECMTVTGTCPDIFGTGPVTGCGDPATYDLTQVDADLIGGQSGVTVEWYEVTMFGGSLLIADPTNFQLGASSTGVEARVSNAFCQSNAQSVSLNGGANPAATNAGLATEYCAGENIDVTVTISGDNPPYSGEFFVSGNLVESFTGFAGGDYSFSFTLSEGNYTYFNESFPSVTDAAGCTSTAVGNQSFTVTAPPTISAPATAPLCLQNGEATEDLTQYDAALGAGEPVQWFEDPAATQVIGNPTAYVFTSSGTIQLYTIVGAGACASDPVAVPFEVTDPPQATNANLPTEVCSGENIDVTVTISGGTPPYSGEFYVSGDLVESFSGFAGGDYSFSFTRPDGDYLYFNETFPFITDATGCTSTAVGSQSLTVTASPTISAPATAPVCLNGFDNLVDLTQYDSALGGGAQVQWFEDQEAMNAITDPMAYLFTTSGNIDLYAVVGTGGCTSDPTAVAFTLVDPPTVTATPPLDLSGTFCLGDEITTSLTFSGGTPPYTGEITTSQGNLVSWTDEDGPLDVTILFDEAGDFEYTATPFFVTDANGCAIATGPTNQVFYSVVEPFTLVCSTTPTEPGQSNGSLVAEVSGGQGPFAFTLTPGTFAGTFSETLTLSGLGVGTYTLEVEDEASGCIEVCTRMIVEDGNCGDVSLAGISTVEVSLDQNCEALLSITDVLAGDFACATAADFAIVVTNDQDADNGPIVDGSGSFIYTVDCLTPNCSGFDFVWGTVNATGDAGCAAVGEGCDRMRDSLALVALYNQTNGPAWDTSLNWLTTAPLEEWFGVGIGPTGCVDTLDLDGVDDKSDTTTPGGIGMRGPLPDAIGGLRNLKFLFLTDNFLLTGGLPDTLYTLSELRHLFIENIELTDSISPALAQMDSLFVFDASFNRMSLADLLPGAPGYAAISARGGSVNIQPQDTIGEPQTFTLAPGDDLTVDLSFELNGGQNVYRWYRDDVLEQEVTGGSGLLSLTDVGIEDAGTYFARISHPGLPGVEVYVEGVTVNVDDPCTPPEPVNPVCIGTLTVTLMPDGDGGGQGSIFASDFVASDVVDCVGDTVDSYSIYREIEAMQSGFTPNSADIGVVFTCEDLNQNPNPVRIYSHPVNGLSDFCQAVVEVQAFNDQVCNDQPTCDDGIQNGEETGVDCGGPDCAPCSGPGFAAEDIAMSGTNETGSLGEEVCVYFVADTLADVSGIQFSVSFPSEQLEFTRASGSLGDTPAFTVESPIGVLRYTVNDFSGEGYFAVEDTIAEVCFMVVDTSRALVEITSEIIPLEVYDSQGQAVTVGSLVPAVINGQNDVTCSDGIQNGTETGVDCGGDCIPCNDCNRERDSLALVALYHATNGPGWINSEGWLTDAPLEEWFGVTTNGSCVRYLELSNNQLAGTLPPSLGQLSMLQILRLNDNQLAGSLPSELGDLSRLITFNLSINNLTGAIPPELGQLSNLIQLRLNRNQLIGSIPPELGQNSSLQALRLDENALTGVIPPEISNIDDLLSFYANSNELEGTIPPGLGQLPNLQRLVLNNNRLIGEIPLELGNLINISHFYLHDNELEGCIPENILSVCLLNLGDTVNLTAGYSFFGNPRLPYQGDFSRVCAGEPQIGAPCDDGNPNTLSDVIQPDCGCGCPEAIPVQLDTVLCPNEFILVNGTEYSLANPTGTEMLTTATGCDSAVTVTITERPIRLENRAAAICDGETYLFYGETYTEAGTFTAFPTCDSVVTLDLTVLPVPERSIERLVCADTEPDFSLTIGGETFDANRPSGQVLVDIPGAECDSLILVNLDFQEPDLDVQNITICFGSPITVDGQSLTADQPVLYDTIIRDGECNLYREIRLEFRNDFDTLRPLLCGDETFEFAGMVYSRDNLTGTHISSTADDAQGCNLTTFVIASASEPYDSLLARILCANDSILVGGVRFDRDNPTGQAVIANVAGGCDTVVTVALAFDELLRNTVNLTGCAGGSVSYRGLTLTEASPLDSLLVPAPVNSDECDSLLLVSATFVSPEFAPDFVIAACPGDVITFGGVDYDQPGVYRDTVRSLIGCDSLITTIRIEALEEYSIEQAATICQGEELLFGDTTLQTEGVFSRVLQSVAGCDSTVSLTLIVVPSYDITLDTMLCPDASIVVNGNTYDADNPTGREEMMTAADCDSIVTVNLSFFEAPQTEVIEYQLCIGDTLRYGDSVIATQSGVYDLTLREATGQCDSVQLTWEVEVVDQQVLLERDTICEGEVLEWRGLSLMETGVAEVTGASADGSCDTLFQMDLLVISPDDFRLRDDAYELLRSDEFLLLDLLQNDSLPYDYELSFPTLPGKGDLEMQGDSVSFFPDGVSSGADSFAYEICLEHCPDFCKMAWVRLNIEFDCVLEFSLNVPNGFTPNNDGKNDVFDPLASITGECLDQLGAARMVIRNVQSEVMFESGDQYRAWDGRDRKGRLVQEGTYWYILEMEDLEEPVSGAVEVVR